MEAVTHLAILQADIERMAVAAEIDLAAPVPSCPGWSMTDLVLHMGRIHRWVDGIVRTRATERPGFPPRPGPDTDLPAWLREGGDRLVEALPGMGDEAVWNFMADGAGRVIGLECSDRDARWVVSFDPDAGRPPALVGDGVQSEADVQGPASDLLLFLWNRVPLGPGSPVAMAGDPAVAAAWRGAAPSGSER